MRLVMAVLPETEGPRPAALVDDVVIDLAAGLPSRGLGGVRDVADLLREGEPALAAVRSLVRHALAAGEGVVPAGVCSFGAPVGGTAPVLCFGVNYRRVARDVSFRAGDGPPVFLKAPTTVIGPSGTVVLPPGVGPVRAEVELGVVIGRRARSVTAAEAMEYVAGYTVLLDVTAQQMMDRDAYRFQTPGEPDAVNHIVMFRAKNHDTFTPVGPALVTRDEIDDAAVSALGVSGRLNGRVYSEGTTADMIVDVAHQIEHLASVLTLRPGDLIATGHPGYLADCDLHDGDRIEASIERIGTLSVDVRGERS